MKYFGNIKEKIEKLKELPISKRLSTRAIFSTIAEVMPELKNKIKENFSALSKLTKENAIKIAGALLLSGSLLLSSVGCSALPQHSSSHSVPQNNEFQDLKNSIVTELGYNPEEVTIAYSRDRNWYLIAAGNTLYSPIGELSDSCKLKDSEGNIIQIPPEMIKKLDEASKRLFFPKYNSDNKTNASSEEPERE